MMAAESIHFASAQPQPVPQAPAGNAVPVTADNFNRAQTDMYFGTIVKDRGTGSLRHGREMVCWTRLFLDPTATLYIL